MGVSRRLAVIMFTDIVGYTAMMSRDEQQALRILEVNRGLQRPLIERYNGEWLKEMGDGVLAAFESTTDALKCAEQIMSAAKRAGIALRIGIHLGEVVFREGDVFGDGVNIASRIESVAIPGSVLFTGRAHDDIRNKPDIKAVFLGKFDLKNVGRPIEIYALAMPGLAVPAASQMQPSSEGRRGAGARGRMTGRLIALAVVAAVALFFVARQFLPPSAPGDSSPITLAAIPFSNVSGDQQADFLGFALADQVINGLSYVRNVVVRPSSTVRKYENQRVEPSKVSKELHVQYVLMGHYLKWADSIRLNLELVNVRENNILWSGTIIANARNVFELQDSVAKHVIQQLSVEFTGGERERMVNDTPGDPLAYEYYLKALAYPLSNAGNHLAIEMLKKSIDLDSTFAPAYGELGLRRHRVARYSVVESQTEETQLALEAFDRALALNPDLLSVLGNLSILKTEMNEKGEALALAQRMVRINPNFAMGHFALSYVYRYAGMLEEAIAEIATGMRLDPGDRRFRSAGIAYAMAGRYKDAIDLLQFTDGSGFSETWRAAVYLRMGEPEKARKDLHRALQMVGTGILSVWANATLVSIDSTSGEWIDRVREIEASLEDPEAMYFWGLLNIRLRDFEGGLDMIEKAVDAGYFPYPAFEIDPVLDPVRHLDRFKSVMVKARQKHEAFKTKYF